MAGTSLSQGSSVTLTVLATDSILIDSGATGTAVIEAVSGVTGAANAARLVNHAGGQATYGPFGAGTVKLSAVGGAITYMQGSAPLTDEGGFARFQTDASGNVTGLVGPDGSNFNFGHKRVDCALIGDSFSARTNNSGVEYRQSDNSFYVWTNIGLNNCLTLVANYGVAGRTTSEMIADSVAVSQSSVGVVFVQGGINDLSASTPASTVVQNLSNICNTLNNKSLVVLLTLAPNVTYAAGVAIVNAGLKEYARTARNVVLVDVFSSVVNPTDTTGDWASGMSNDGLHLSVQGCQAYGSAIANAIAKFLPFVDYLPSSAFDSWAVNSTSKQILANPLMTGSSGSVSGVGASGTVATGWNCGTDTGTITSVWLHGQTRGDSIGFDQQATVSGAGVGSAINLRQTSGPLTSRVSAGDYIYACGSVSLSGLAAIASVQPYIAIVMGGTTYNVHALDPSNSTWSQSDRTIVWKTQQFLLSEVPTTLNLFIKIGFNNTGSGVIRFGRTGLYKVQ